MARLNIDLPEKVIYTAEIAVRATDLNYGGHVGNDTILTLIQEARVQMYRSFGFENEMKFEGTVGHIIADAAIVYKSEAFLGDVIAITISVADFNKYGFDMFYRLVNKQSGKEVARAKTGIVCFDYEKRKVVSVPGVLINKLQPAG